MSPAIKTAVLRAFGDDGDLAVAMFESIARDRGIHPDRIAMLALHKGPAEIARFRSTLHDGPPRPASRGAN